MSFCKKDAAEVAFDFGDLIAKSEKMRLVFEMAGQVARRDSTVLLVGESGTGKELLARAIHQNGPRRANPFVPINCGAIPETLIESELFGHLKGSFTGALTDRIGKFEAADGGTAFLDEINELSSDVQVKLLRVIQEREIDKVGYPRPIKINIRIVAASSRNLRSLTEGGRFREDLFYRLSVATVTLPPLRERPEDIPLLAKRFFAKCCGKYTLPPVSLAPGALKILMKYAWPGNVRELENVIECLVVFAKGSVIRPEDLPVEVRNPRPRIHRLNLELPENGITFAEIEEEIFRQALERHGWNQSRAARYLNITRQTLIYRMQKYSIRPPAEKAAKRESRA